MKNEIKRENKIEMRHKNIFTFFIIKLFLAFWTLNTWWLLLFVCVCAQWCCDVFAFLDAKLRNGIVIVIQQAVIWAKKHFQ